MRTEDRESNSPLTPANIYQLLEERPWRFSFLQAMRLLRLRQERVSIEATASLAYPAGDIQSYRAPSDGNPSRLTVNFMGLTGPFGVLPHAWTELVENQNREQRPELFAFLNIFNDRMMQLFYGAWEKHHTDVALERGEQYPAFLRILRSFLGLGLESFSSRMQPLLSIGSDAPLYDRGLAWYSGLLGMLPRSASALAQLLEEYFGVPVQIEQFAHNWRSLPAEIQCKLGSDGSTATALGIGTIVGDEMFEASSRVGIRIGPLSRSRYEEFLPGGSAHDSLSNLLRFFSAELEFDVQLVLMKTSVPGYEIGTGNVRLGWTTWMMTPSRAQDADDTLISLHSIWSASMHAESAGIGEAETCHEHERTH